MKKCTEITQELLEMSGWKFSPEDEKDVIKDYENNVEIRTIEKKYGMSITQISRILKQNKVLRLRSLDKSDRRYHLKDNIIKDFENGMPLRQVMRKHKFGYNAVNDILRAAGYNPSQSPRSKHKESRRADIISAIRQKVPYKEISKKYKVSNATVVKFAKDDAEMNKNFSTSSFTHSYGNDNYT